MINLYDKNCTNFNNNGLVVLSDCKSCFIEEKLNDAYELTLEYPLDNRGKWKYLVEGNIIKADGQLFRIYHKQKTLTGIQVNARHIFYDLMDNFIESCTITNTTGAGALDSIMSSTQYSHSFSYMSDITALNSLTIDKKNPVEAIMGQGGLIDIWGGEVVRDNFTIKILQARGLDRGVTIRYGKNITGIEETLDIDNVITRIYPVGKDGLLLPEKYIDSSIIGNYPHPKVRSVEFNDADTEDALRTAANGYMAGGVDVPNVNYKIDFLELTKTSEYKNYAVLETVYMGDTVTVRHSKLNINLKCKVIRIKKNILTGRIEEVELGNFRPTLADTFSNIQQSVDDMSTQQAQDKSDLQKAIGDATTQINTALGGYVLKRNGELLIMDTQDVETAQNVWRWNLGGLGHSSTGYNGEFKTAITQDGHIVADFVNTGSMDASIVKTGTITSKNGKISIGLDDDSLNIGGKLVYDNTTGKLTFASDVTIDWSQITNQPTIPKTAADIGARPDTWTPTAADVGALATNWVGTTHIDANGLYTGAITANQIEVGTLTGFTIQTAASGARLVLNASTFSGYNSSNYLTWQLKNDGLYFSDPLSGAATGYMKTGSDGEINITGYSALWFDILGDSVTALSINAGVVAIGDGYYIYTPSIQAENTCSAATLYGDKLGGLTNHDKASFGTSNCRFDTTGGTFRIFTSAATSADYGISLSTSGEVDFKCNNATNAYITGAGAIHGTSKSAITPTLDYGTVITYSDESPDHVFNDRGRGQLDSSGQCIVSLDPKWAETVNTSKSDYIVLLTGIGTSNVYVDSLQPDYFVVKGEPGKEFFWTITAERYGYEGLRWNDADLDI